MESETKRTCLFCGEGGLTLEHVWPQWIWKLYHKEPQRNRYSVRRTGTGQSDHLRKASTLDQKIRIACGDCNNGWMSRLENQIAKPALASFILFGDTPRIITAPEETAIVAWAMKMAYVLDFTTVRGAAPHYSAEQRRQFANTLTPPVGVTLWIANYMPDRNRRAHSSITNLRLTPRDRPDITFRAQVSTFAVGKLAFQLLHTFTPDNAAPFDWRKATQDRPEKATLQMWPSPGGLMSWPPSEYFDDIALDAFGSRFGIAPTGA